MSSITAKNNKEKKGGTKVMFFSVQYGDASSMLLNANCKCKILLEKMKEKSHQSSEEIIDIADMQAVVQKLCDQPEEIYASDVLQPRGNYVLIKVIKRLDESGQFCKEYVPLLNGIETVNPDFLNRLSNRKVNPDACIKDVTRKRKGAESRLGGSKPRSNVNLSTEGSRRSPHRP